MIVIIVIIRQGSDMLRDLRAQTPRMHYYMPVDNRLEKSSVFNKKA